MKANPAGFRGESVDKVWEERCKPYSEWSSGCIPIPKSSISNFEIGAF